MLDPAKAVDEINARFGRHAGHRALHAKGTLCEATFTATPAAAKLTVAAHMQDEPAPALVRLSNGSGNPRVPDYAPDVRGIAISFELPDGSRTDLLGQTAPRFPVDSPEAFVEFVRVSDRKLTNLPRLLAFLARHPTALVSLRHNVPLLSAPPSYATCRFFPVHAFRFTDADGASRYVRYTIEPEEESAAISTGEAKERGRDYLQNDLRERLAGGSFRYRMLLQIALDDDNVDDPRSVWPEDREVVDAGVLEVTAVHPDQSLADRMVFDPLRLCPGIEPAADPILSYRPLAYSESFERRSAG